MLHYFTVWKNRYILSLEKFREINLQIASEKVDLTEFSYKKRESKIPQFPHCVFAQSFVFFEKICYCTKLYRVSSTSECYALKKTFCFIRFFAFQKKFLHSWSLLFYANPNWYFGSVFHSVENEGLISHCEKMEIYCLLIFFVKSIHRALLL